MDGIIYLVFTSTLLWNGIQFLERRMKRLDVGELSYRNRRGKWVEVPEEWVGITVSPQTKRKRQSKATRKNKNDGIKNNRREFGNGKYLKYKRGEDVFGET